MSTSQINTRRKILKILLVFLELTPTQIAKMLHVSNSVISKHISGEKTYYPCDIFLIEQIFHIKVKEYSKICQ